MQWLLTTNIRVIVVSEKAGKVVRRLRRNVVDVEAVSDNVNH